MLYVLNGSIAVVLFVLIFAFGVKLNEARGDFSRIGRAVHSCAFLLVPVFFGG